MAGTARDLRLAPEEYDPGAGLRRRAHTIDTLQETVQAVNRTIREFADDPRIAVDEVWEFFCECGCFTLVPLSLGDYDGGAGVWAAGHGAGSSVDAG